MNKSNFEEIRDIKKLIMLHLLPGILLCIVYVFLVTVMETKHLPKVIILSISTIFSIVPFELGLLCFVSKKETGSINFLNILGLRNRIKFTNLLIWALGLFVLTGILITVLKPISEGIKRVVFGWLPDWFLYVEDINGFSKAYILIAVIFSFVFLTLLGPICEELYFRGYLLERIKWMGKYGVILNVLLFSIYHFWSPWMVITRIIALFPLYYCTYKKDSLKLAIFVHCLCNFTDVVAILVLYLQIKR